MIASILFSQVWLFERVPELHTPKSLICVPRFLRWELPHPKLEQCVEKLKSVKKIDVHQFYVTRAEEQFRRASREVILCEVNTIVLWLI